MQASGRKRKAVLVLIALCLGGQGALPAQTVTRAPRGQSAASILRENNERIEALSQKIDTMKARNTEIMKDINYLRIRARRKTGGRRFDLEAELEKDNEKLRKKLFLFCPLCPELE